MAEPIKILDGEAVIETARVEVFMIGSGVIVTATLVEEDGTAIIAGSEIIPVLGDLSEATEAATRVLKALRSTLDDSVTGEAPELFPGTKDALGALIRDTLSEATGITPERIHTGRHPLDMD